MTAIGSTESTKVLFSSAWCRFCYRPHRAKFIPNSLWCDLSPVAGMIRKMDDITWMAIESWLISRGLTEEPGPWNTSLSMDDDGEYFSPVIGASERVAFVAEAKSYIRKANPSSLSKSLLSPEELASQLRSVTPQIEHLHALDDSALAPAAWLFSGTRKSRFP